MLSNINKAFCGLCHGARSCPIVKLGYSMVSYHRTFMPDLCETDQCGCVWVCVQVGGWMWVYECVRARAHACVNEWGGSEKDKPRQTDKQIDRQTDRQF